MNQIIPFPYIPFLQSLSRKLFDQFLVLFGGITPARVVEITMKIAMFAGKKTPLAVLLYPPFLKPNVRQLIGVNIAIENRGLTL